eukprot:ANDGO_06043.mRNA.1 hypothetical protein
MVLNPVVLPPIGATMTGNSSNGIDLRKLEICTKPLHSGFVQVYADIFRIAFRPPILIDELSETYFQISHAQLAFVCESLMDAEEFRRQSDARTAYERIVSVAELFASNKDISTSLLFYERGLQLAKASADPALEGVALQHLGDAYETVGNLAAAVPLHEAHFQLVQDAGLSEDHVLSARIALVEAYVRLSAVFLVDADRLLGNPKDELVMREILIKAQRILEKGLDVARIGGDEMQQRDLEHRLAQVHVKLGDVASAVALEQSALQGALNQNDPTARAKALFALADLDTSTARWGEYLKVAEDLGDIEGQCEAHEKLARLFREEKNLKSCVVHLELNFATAQKTGDLKRVDRARMLLGMARAECGLPKYMHLVNHDFPALLRWKSGQRDVLQDDIEDKGSTKLGTSAGTDLNANGDLHSAQHHQTVSFA